VFVIVVADKLTATKFNRCYVPTQVKQGAPVQVALGSSGILPWIPKACWFRRESQHVFRLLRLAPGQTVRFNVSSTGSSTTGTAFNQVTVSKVTLRFSRLTGNIRRLWQAIPSSIMTSTTIPALFALTSNPQVQIFTGVTLFDGAFGSDRSYCRKFRIDSSALFTVSTPSFFAAKVRSHKLFSASAKGAGSLILGSPLFLNL